MRLYWIFILVMVLAFIGCKPEGKDDMDPGKDLTDIPYAPEYYTPEIPESFPPFEQPEDNRMTRAGVELGRHLFYDPILSADSSMSCFSCHGIKGGFTDNEATSEGIDGIRGRRSSMSLLNAAYFFNGLFWDGRSPHLEDQAKRPVEDVIELHDTWDHVEEKLRRHQDYPGMFREAFGISNSNEIDRELAARALAQFQRNIITGGESKYHRFLRRETFLDESQQRGMDMYFDNGRTQGLPDAECGHCHNGALLTADDYFNNGLDPFLSPEDLEDQGRFEVTGFIQDLGKFRAPSLINIEYTAPYMHDGRFETLEEVLRHYNTGVHFAENLDPNLKDDRDTLTESQLQDLLNFLKTFSDTSYFSLEILSNPFE